VNLPPVVATRLVSKLLWAILVSAKCKTDFNGIYQENVQFNCARRYLFKILQAFKIHIATQRQLARRGNVFISKYLQFV